MFTINPDHCVWDQTNSLMKKLIALLLLIYATSLLAAGPETVAFSNRSLWPDAIDSQSAFDQASRAEILVFAEALSEFAILAELDPSFKAEFELLKAKKQ